MQIDTTIFNREDLNMYFANTFLLHKKSNAFVHIEQVQWSEEANENLFYHGDGNGLSSSDLEIPVIEEGFINNADATAYVSKKNIRQYKKGLRRDGLAIRSLSNSVDHVNAYSQDVSFRAVRFEDVLKFKTNGSSYPTFDECLKALLDKKSVGAAFHPDWALYIDTGSLEVNLSFRGSDVGNFDPISGEIMFDEKGIAVRDRYLEVRNA